jgi:cysteine-rich repeat protein
VLRHTIVLFALTVPAFACGGGDPECGNGVMEDGEGCDDGNDVNDDNCTNACQLNLPETLDATIKWAFNKNAAPLFDQDSCFDMRVTNVEVEIRHTSNNEAVFTGAETCGFKQVTFLDIPAGDYLARVSPFDIDGNLKTVAVIEQLFTISTQDVEVTVNVPYDQWKDDYTGTFFFRLHWGAMGVDCAAGVPPVAQHRLTLEREGTPVSQLTDVGDRLNGTMPGACRSLSEEFPQSALLVPWGPYELIVVGLDSGGEPQFAKTFDTFVGAGVSNPEMDFVVNSLAPDAGVPDAGSPDAGVPDAAL